MTSYFGVSKFIESWILLKKITCKIMVIKGQTTDKEAFIVF